MTYKAGDKLCACTLLQKCGEGGYGEVWLAEDVIGTRVALKILSGSCPDREISGLKNYKDCSHPNLLKIRHVEITEQLIAYTMDAADDLNDGNGRYLPDTLANRLDRYGHLDGKEILEMLEGLLAGLEELHRHGLVHRDIKPDNILWVNGRATLSDAGLIVPAGKHTLVGSPGFISPRLLESGGVAETGDDFYALSKVVYCALTGLAPTEYPEIPQNITLSLDPAINRALCAGCDRDQTVRSAEEFRRIVAGKSVPSTPTAKSEQKIRTAGQTKTMRTFKIAFLALALVLVAIVLWIVRSEYRQRAGNDPEQERTGKTQPESAPAELGGLHEFPDIKQEFLRKRAAQTENLFRKGKLFTAEKFQELLSHQVYTVAAFDQKVDQTMKTYWGSPEYIRFFSLKQLTALHWWKDPDPALIKSRQEYWAEQPGAPAEKVVKMLQEDPVMQLAAVNFLLKEYCCGVLEELKRKEFEDGIRKNLDALIMLQFAFIDPDGASILYSNVPQPTDVNEK